MSRGVARAVLGCLVVLTPFLESAPALANCRARFTCDFGTRPYCYFVVRSYGRDKYFRVAAGGAQMLYGIEGSSRFCSSTAGPPDGDSCSQKPVKMSCD
jgi:hypothetical protein